MRRSFKEKLARHKRAKLLKFMSSDPPFLGSRERRIMGIGWGCSCGLCCKSRKRLAKRVKHQVAPFRDLRRMG